MPPAAMLLTGGRGLQLVSPSRRLVNTYSYASDVHTDMSDRRRPRQKDHLTSLRGRQPKPYASPRTRRLSHSVGAVPVIRRTRDLIRAAARPTIMVGELC
jgi:hypothetical protein